jgi:hypothetical protein
MVISPVLQSFTKSLNEKLVWDQFQHKGSSPVFSQLPALELSSDLITSRFSQASTISYGESS